MEEAAEQQVTEIERRAEAVEELGEEHDGMAVGEQLEQRARALENRADAVREAGGKASYAIENPRE